MKSTVELMRSWIRDAGGIGMAARSAAHSVGTLLMRMGTALGVRSEIALHFTNWKRQAGCACRGCRNEALVTSGERRHEEFTPEQLACVHRTVAWQDHATVGKWNPARIGLLVLVLFAGVAMQFWSLPVIIGATQVTTEGKNDQLTQYFKGSAYTAAWFVALVDNASFGAYAAGDTAAKICTSGNVNSPTTNNWAEGTPYSNATRVAWTGGTAGSGSIDNSASAAAFTINATLTVKGAFLISNSTKGGTTGKLYGAGDFTAARSVVSGDTLNVTVTLTV